MKNWLLMPIVTLLFCGNAMAFGPARIKPPAELASFTAVDQNGQAALAEIEKQKWERRKVVTLAANTERQVQVLVRQTAEISLSGDVLKIKSSAGDSALDGNMFAGQTDGYSSQNFNAPVIYTGQSVSSDGSIQLAVGVDCKDGAAVDKNANKISLTMYKDEIFSGPDSYGWNDHEPDFDHGYIEQLVQFVVFSWNKNNPGSLTIKGISDSDSTSDQFSTTYSVEQAAHQATAQPGTIQIQ